MDQLLLEIDEKIARCNRIYDPKLKIDARSRVSYQNIVEYVNQIRLLKSIINDAALQNVITILKKTSMDLDKTNKDIDRLYRYDYDSGSDDEQLN